MLHTTYPIVYACYNKDEIIRRKSSSGGIFYLIAQYTIDCGGVVFGAKFTQDWEVVHGYCESINDLEEFIGSKYVQSKIGDMYQYVEEILKSGRMVLFSGTPCQIQGLSNYLSILYDNLILVDFICHGVPSPKVWKQYLEEKMSGKQINHVNFRDKTDGWERFSLKLDYDDEKSYRKTQREDPFLKGFLKDIYLRPSCYECKFKGIHRIADITLGDFWGVQKYLPHLFDDKGTSIMLLHSKKGEIIFSMISSSIKLQKIDIDVVKVTNVNLVSSVVKPKGRMRFFKKSKDNIVRNIESLTKESLQQRIKYNMKRMVKKLIKYGQ